MKFHDAYKGMAQSALNIPMRDDDAREVEKLLDSGEYSPLYKQSIKIESFSPGERSDISVISDGSVDSDKEILIPKGIDFSRFQKNPIVTFNHNWSAPPIAKSLWQKLLPNGEWKAKTQYASRPENHPSEKEWIPDTIWHLVKEGFLPGKSIGGVGKSRLITKEDIEKNPSWAGAKRIVDEVLIYEYSVVSVQANKNAIVEAVAKSLVQVPEDFLQTNFPEVYKVLKETQVDLPSIKSYKTLEEHQAEIRNTFIKRCADLPNLVDDALSSVLGRV